MDLVVYGVFNSVAATKQGELFFDPNIFDFSFESHGQNMMIQRFVAKNEQGMVHPDFFKNDDGVYCF